jgi:4,5-DOPA dioxygenase extradiol
MYPKANIPTIQISIDEELPREKIFAIGKELNQLRKDGILILGSGNIVHNLGAIKRNDSPYQWASEFDEYIKKKIRDKEYQAIIDFEKHPIINLALPTVEHFLPLLYIVGAAE